MLRKLVTAALMLALASSAAPAPQLSATQQAASASLGSTATLEAPAAPGRDAGLATPGWLLESAPGCDLYSRAHLDRDVSQIDPGDCEDICLAKYYQCLSFCGNFLCISACLDRYFRCVNSCIPF